MSTKTEFSIDKYIDLINTIIKAGYKFETNKKITRKSVLLRHDIDLNLNLGVKLSEIENYLNITSLFCIMVDNPFYSLDTDVAKQHIERILNNGHEIGLHYDVDSEMTFKDQIDYLESITGKKISFFSQHQPTIHGIIQDKSMEKYKNLYDSKFTNKMKYVSDSCMAPRIDFYDVIGNFNFIHILIHPEFWVLEANDLDDFKLKMLTHTPKELFSKLNNIVEEMKKSILLREFVDHRTLEN